MQGDLLLWKASISIRQGSFLLASAVHYQAYLIDGITRWNAVRSVAAVESSVKEHVTLQTFELQLQYQVCYYYLGYVIVLVMGDISI